MDEINNKIIAFLIDGYNVNKSHIKINPEITIDNEYFQPSVVVYNDSKFDMPVTIDDTRMTNFQVYWATYHILNLLMLLKIVNYNIRCHYNLKSFFING